MLDRKLNEKILTYIDAGFPIIYINTFEEDKIDKILLSGELRRLYRYHEWNGAKGGVYFETKKQWGLDSSIQSFLDYFISSPEELGRTILVIKDIVPYLDDPEVVARLKEIVRLINNGADACIIIVSETVKIPKELEKYITVLETSYLTVDEIKEIINSFLSEYDLGTINEELLEKFSVSFKGLSEFEILNILALAYSNDGEFTESDLQIVMEQKRQAIKKGGVLDMVSVKETIDDIGGLDNLKKWLENKAKVFKNYRQAKEYGVDTPKGLLIVGVPGCGKSLTAKATAAMFGMPLLRLDMGRLLGKYVGESEENMRRAVALAEAVSPCILWIDELEKAFAGIGGNGEGSEVTTRLFGSFLSWMQEKTSPTFVVATANDITKLPPELLRKGRFDEIFFVDLPNKEERKAIFDIHIKRRREKDYPQIKEGIDELVKSTEGYSGADIEGVVSEAVEEAFVSGEELTIEKIKGVIDKSIPLSRTMKEALEKMKKEYSNRNIKNATK